VKVTRPGQFLQEQMLFKAKLRCVHYPTWS